MTIDHRSINGRTGRPVAQEFRALNKHAAMSKKQYWRFASWRLGILVGLILVVDGWPWLDCFIGRVGGIGWTIARVFPHARRSVRSADIMYICIHAFAIIIYT